MACSSVWGARYSGNRLGVGIERVVELIEAEGLQIVEPLPHAYLVMAVSERSGGALLLLRS
ncbi:MAG: hypothetical protein CM1200mP36_03550 [Gammaproteobacteria bacterium]|nr:MAG: hypothetical protein CM1200mP36_03550 [Gammaproteobacteria bacterium]